MKRCLLAAITTALVCLSAGAQVAVTGSGSVGIGTMSGGTINIQGITPAELNKALKAQGAERTRLLKDIAAKLNAAQPQQGFSETVIHGFLATIVGKRVPEAEWPKTFAEIAARHLELLARVQAGIASNPTGGEAKRLLELAKAAIQASDHVRAEALLVQAEQLAVAEAKQLKAQATAARSTAATILATRGSLALTQLEREKGARLLEQAFEQRAEDADSAAIWWLFEAADAWLNSGRSNDALRSYRSAERAATIALLTNPQSTQWQRDVSVSHIKIGDVLRAQGDGPGALAAFRKGLTIAETLAARDPANTEWQRDLSVSHNKIGDVLQAQGDGPGALAAFRMDLAIAEMLAARNPANSEWQRDLSVSHNKIGNVLQAQGDGPGALAAFRKDLAIAEMLAARNPANSEWQVDWAISHSKFGAFPSLPLAERRAHLERGLAILERLAGAARLHAQSDHRAWFKARLAALVE